MKKKIKNILKRIYIILLKFLRIFICKKRVIFISFSGEQYSDNPRAISEKLHSISPITKQIWFFYYPEKFENIVPSYVKIKPLKNFILLFYLATSKVWIDNDYLCYDPIFAKLGKTKKQLFIQTWHGDRGFKKCYYNIEDYSRKTRFNLEIDGFCDYVLTGSEFAENVFPSMFNYRGNLLKVGYPRNDILFENDKSKKEGIKESIGIGKNDFVILYAPTFRKLKKGTEINPDFENLVKCVQKKVGKNCVILKRYHHLIHSKTYFNNIIDVSKYPDMAELLSISDMLITDYSSCAGDFILKNMPLILFVPDKENYIKNDRGLHFELDDSPFFCATNENQLENIIQDLDKEKVISNCDAIKDFYKCYENGNASQKVCEVILNFMK